MIIQHNIAALKAFNCWNEHNNRSATALGRLSSGYRINSAADDPAGLAVSERMKAQLTSLKRQKMNAMDSLSSVQTHEAVQGEVSDMLLRMQELATQAMTGTLDDTDRKNLNEEYQQLISEINRENQQSKQSPISLFRDDHKDKLGDSQSITISGNNLDAYLDALDVFLKDVATAAANGDKDKLTSLGLDESLITDKDKVQQAILNFTEENAQKLLSTSPQNGKNQSASIVLENGNIKVNLLYENTDDLGLAGTDILNAENAGKALNALKGASAMVSKQRAHYGAISNRLEHTMNNISTMEENLESSISRITDADMAKEMTEFVRSKALAQAAMFVMSYSLHEPESVLQLLKSV